MHNTRIIALDLDGTLINPDRTIAPETLEKMAELSKRQILFVIVTGRPYSAVLEILGLNGLGAEFPEFLICEGRDIYHLQGGAYEPWSAWNGRLLNDERRLLDVAREILAEFQASWTGAPLQVNDRDVQQKRGFVELVCRDTATARSVFAALCALVGNNPSIKTVRNGSSVALRSQAIGKAAVLRELIRYLDVPAQSVLTVGDSQNDLDMLSSDFLPATTNNADPEVKALVGSRGGLVARRDCSLGVYDILARVAAQTNT